MKLVTCILAIILSACCDNSNTVQTVSVDSGMSVTDIINSENSYRATVGQEPLTQGLSCTLYTVPTSTVSIQTATLTSVATFEYDGPFNQQEASVTAGLNILPSALSAVYQTWFVVKCSGDIVYSTSDYHEFTSLSDDGSLVYLDGTILVNNDGLHSSQTVSATKYMKYGIHSIQIAFFQGGGMQQLIVLQDAGQINPTSLYH